MTACFSGRRALRAILALEIFFAIFPVLCFRLIENRMTAALTAGSGFLIFGSLIVGLCWLQVRPTKFYTFWLGHFFLLGVAIPIFVARLSTQAEFSQIYVLGVPGPLFHRFSNYAYLLLTIATIWDLRRLRAGQQDQG